MYNIGVDFGGTQIKAGIIDVDGNVLIKHAIDTYRKRDYKEIIKDIGNLCLQLIKKSNLEISDIYGIGIGCTGVSDSKNGLLIYSSSLNFDKAPISEELQKYINLPVYLENDANVAALAESTFGACKGSRISLTITLGTGIGGGIIIDGRPFSGFNNAAGELGHIVINMDGEACGCGRKGCWEAYASGTALIRQTREAITTNDETIIKQLIKNDIENINAKVAFDAAKVGDNIGKIVVSNYIKYLAEGLSNIINVIQPEVIAIGGGISKEGEYLLEPLRKMVYERVYASDKIPQAKIVVATLGNDAGIIGASLICRIEDNEKC